MRMYFVQVIYFLFVAALENEKLCRQEKSFEVLLQFQAVLHLKKLPCLT